MKRCLPSSSNLLSNALAQFMMLLTLPLQLDLLLLSSFPTQLKLTVVQLFESFFPLEFLKENILFIINLKMEGKSVTYGELLKWIGIWFLMERMQGTKRYNFWSVAPTNIFDNAPKEMLHAYPMRPVWVCNSLHNHTEVRISE